MNFAVIDTETNMQDEVISLGLVVADCDTIMPVGKYYFVFHPECCKESIFASSLYIVTDVDVNKFKGLRPDCMVYAKQILDGFKVKDIFAYNARFDRNHLPEMQSYNWYDIIRLSAYKEFNKFITDDHEVHPRSGKLKRGYGVEPIYRLVTGDQSYREKHNGYTDAIDELCIMRSLGLPFDAFLRGKITGRKIIT